MLNIPFPKSSNLNFFHFAKITEQLRTYQVQRDILVDEQRSHDFSSSVCFLFAITDGMVKVLVGGCFGSDLFDLTNISNSFMFPSNMAWKIGKRSHISHIKFAISILCTRHTVSLVFLVETLQLVQKCSLSAGHFTFLAGGKTSESLGYIVISPLAIIMEFLSTFKNYNSDLLSLKNNQVTHNKANLSKLKTA